LSGNTDPTVFSPDLSTGEITLLQAGSYLARTSISASTSVADGFWAGAIYNVSTNTSLVVFTLLPTTSSYQYTPSSPEVLFTATAGTVIAVRFLLASDGGNLAIRANYSGLVIEKVL
jgi:hypothetical protein